MEQIRFTQQDIEELVKKEVERKGYTAVNIFTHTQGVIVDVVKKEEE